MVSVWDYSFDPAGNSNVSGAPMYEGMTPAQLNNSIRAIMSHIAAMRSHVTPFMYGAVGDGVTDDTTAVQAMLDSGLDCYFPAYIFVCGPLTMSSDNQTVELSPGASIKAKAAMNGVMLTVSGDNVVVRGGILDGNTASVTASNGILITGGNCTVELVSAVSNKGYAFKSVNADRPRFINNFVYESSGHAIHVSASNTNDYGDAQIIGNHISRVGVGTGTTGGGIVVEGIDPGRQRRGVVSHNTIALPSGASDVAARCIYLYACNGYTVTGNSTRDGYGGIFIATSSAVNVTGNCCLTPTSYGIALSVSENVDITGNQLSGGGTADYGVIFYDSYRSTVTGNNIHNFDVYAFDMVASTAITVDHIAFVGNVLRDNTANVGSSMTGSAVMGNNVVIQGNPGVTDYLDYKNGVIQGVGTGTPEGSVTGGVGSIFHRRDGGASTTLYVKQSGSGNTGWVGK